MGIGIKRKLLLSYLAIAIPLILVIVITQYNFYRDKQSDVVTDRTVFARSMASNVDNVVREISTLEKTLGYTIYDNNLTRRDASAHLAKIANNHPAICIDYVRVTGEIYASSDAGLVGTHISHGDYDITKYILNMTREKDVVISPLYTYDSGIVGFDLVAGIWKKKGLAGVVVMSIDSARFDELMPAVTVKGDYNITDSSGMVVYQSQNPDMPLSKRNWNDREFVEQALSGDEFTTNKTIFPVDYDGRIGSQVPIKSIGWTVGSFIPVEDAMAPVNTNVIRGGLIILTIIILALFIGIWTIYGIINPVATLTRKAKDMAGGNLNEDISNLETETELRELAQSFNTMRVGLKEYVDELHGLVNAGKKINSAKDIESVNEAVVDALKDNFDVTAVWMALYDDHKKKLIINHTWGPEEFNLSGLEVAPGEGVTGKVLMTAEPVIIKEIKSSEFIYKDILIKAAVDSAIVLPLISGGGPIGTVGLCTPLLEEGKIDKKEKNLLMALANQAAVAIENARLYDEARESKRNLKEENKDLQVLNKLSLDIASGLGSDIMLEKIERSVLKLVDADFASISIYNNETDEVSYRNYLSDPEKASKLHKPNTDMEDNSSEANVESKIDLLPKDLGFSELVLKVKKTVYTNDYKHDANVDKKLKKLGIKAAMIVPMLSAGRVVGFLQIGRFDKREFLESDVTLLEPICALAAIVLENSKLCKREGYIAERLRSLLPTMPGELHGVRIGNLYRPANDKMGTRGDFYDYIEFGDGRIGIVIGDVSGKGIEAASNTAIAKMAVHASAYDHNSPADVLKYVNQIISNQPAHSGFITMAYIVIDPSTGAFTYSSAGHPSPMIADYATFKTRHLEEGSVPLGADENAKFKDSTGKLDLGEVLLFYTNGLTEARNENELFGEERIAEAVLSANDPDIELIPQRLIESVEKFSDGKLDDDLAVVVVILDTGHSPNYVDRDTKNDYASQEAQSDESEVGETDSSYPKTGANDRTIMNLIGELESGIGMDDEIEQDKHEEPEVELENLEIEEMIRMGLIETDMPMDPIDFPTDLSDDIETIGVEQVDETESPDKELDKLAYEALASLGEPETADDTNDTNAEGSSESKASLALVTTSGKSGAKKSSKNADKSDGGRSGLDDEKTKSKKKAKSPKSKKTKKGKSGTKKNASNITTDPMDKNSEKSNDASSEVMQKSSTAKSKSTAKKKNNQNKAG